MRFGHGFVVGGVVTVFALLATVSSVGCTADLPGDEGGSGRGAIELAVAAPPSGVGCLRVTTAGTRTVVKTLAITAGVPVSSSLTGLPTGMVAVTAEAFAEACAMVTPSSNPSWTGDPINVTLAAGVVTPVQLIMRQNGRLSLSVEWDTGVADGGTTTVCPGCAQLSVPLLAENEQAIYLVNMFAAPVNAGASVSARVCAVSGSGGGIQLLVEDANFQIAGAFELITNLPPCGQGFRQLGIALPTLDSTRIASVGFQVLASAPGPWTNPTIVNVDSITLANHSEAWCSTVPASRAPPSRG